MVLNTLGALASHLNTLLSPKQRCQTSETAHELIAARIEWTRLFHNDGFPLGIQRAASGVHGWHLATRVKSTLAEA